jgi:hypothetical protein
MKKLISEISKNARSHGSLPFWSWNDKLEPEELKRQIHNMHGLGMNGFFMHARGGLETEYLGEDWFKCVDACVGEAKKLGMEAWSYDENGWPSGFAGGKLLEDPANHARFLRFAESDTWPEGNNVLGVYIREGDKITRVEAPIDGAKYYVITCHSDSSYVDTLDADITAKFIAATHEEYLRRGGEDFGGAMPGFFTDEPQYYRWATPWSDKLPFEFDKKFGYDVLDMLPALFIDCDGDREFRYDYYLLLHTLFIGNFIKPIYDWCQAHGCKITGHAVEESALSGQMWCCGGVMPFYEYEDMPGIDYLGRGLSSDLAPRQLGSVCAQLGKKKALSEMFGCCGWDVSPTELKRIAELQYAGGVNVMCQHLYSYSIRGQRKRDYPAHYSEHLPWQKHLARFDNYFNNLGGTLSRGEESADVLVIHPMHSAYLTYKRDADYGSVAQLSNRLFELSDLLGGHQIAYHYGDEILMAKYASAQGAKLRVGLCEYKYVIVPECDTLDATTAALLKKYLAAGGRLYMFGAAPTRIDGRKAELDWLVPNLTFDDIRGAAEFSLSRGVENVPSIRVMVRNTDCGRIFYAVNLSDKSEEGVIARLSGCKKVCGLDMDTLAPYALRGKNVAGDTMVTLDFEPGQSYVLLESDEAPDFITDAPSKPAQIKLSGKFSFASKPQNAFTLDHARVSTDGITFGEPRPIEEIRDTLLRDKYRGGLWLKFEFDVDELPGKVNVAIEPMKYTCLEFNGAHLVPGAGHWLDASFVTTDLTAWLRLGKNELVLGFDYFQRDYVYYVLYAGVSESLRNCLAFDTEVECPYLFGDFAVKTDRARFTPSERNSLCYDGAFALTAQKTEVDAENIVADGYPFFAGEMELETVYNYKPGGGTLLELGGRWSVCEVYVNGAPAATLMFTRRCDIATYLREGENTIKLKLYNSNRNLLGPHHRHDPEPYGLGPNTFSFEGEWHDGKCGAYLPRYAFVQFGVEI